MTDAQHPTTVERIANRVCNARTLVCLLGVAVAWIVLNSASGALEVDPFPFRWLQRVSTLVNGALVSVALRARSERRARLVRQEQTLRAQTNEAERPALYALVSATRGPRPGQQRSRPH